MTIETLYVLLTAVTVCFYSVTYSLFQREAHSCAHKVCSIQYQMYAIKYCNRQGCKCNMYMNYVNAYILKSFTNSHQNVNVLKREIHEM